MKTGLLFSLIAAFSVAGAANLSAQGTAFVYEGQLKQHGQAAHGEQDLRFSLYNVANNGSPIATQEKANVRVEKGAFTVTLDFGNVFDGNPRWLEISVKGKKGDFVALNPRQKFMPTPYAMMANSASNLLGTLPASKITGMLPASQISGPIEVAGSIPMSQITGVLPSGQLSGTYSSAINLNNPSNNFVGNGAGLVGVDAVTLKGLGPESFWKLTGNGGTSPATNFLGTKDNQALEVRVNNQRALRLEPGTNGAPNFVAGSPGNFVGTLFGGGPSGPATMVATGIYGATISGGGSMNGFQTNWIASSFASIGGGAANSIATAEYATIGGGYGNQVARADHGPNYGGKLSTIGGGATNKIYVRGGVIGGGFGNSIGQEYSFPGEAGSTIGGGIGNRIGYEIGGGCTIAGGTGNFIDQTYSTIGGGSLNTMPWGNSSTTGNTIGGGYGNYIQNVNPWQENIFGFSVIAGGSYNKITASYAAVPGGISNSVSGAYSMAAGRRAKADHQGAFVWADGNNADFHSIITNSFSVRATGGARIVSAIDTNGTPIAGVELPSGGGAWATLSDRDSKENLTPVDARKVLEQVSQMPISTWNYKSQDTAVRHIGPMAQDFAAAFNVGENDRRITTVDADGVALAAIQGLNQVVKEKDAEIQQLKQRLEKLEQLINQNKGHAP